MTKVKTTSKRMIDLIEDVTADELRKNQELEQDTDNSDSEPKLEGDMGSEKEGEEDEVKNEEIASDDIEDKGEDQDNKEKTEEAGEEEGGHGQEFADKQKLIDKVMKNLVNMSKEELQDAIKAMVAADAAEEAGEGESEATNEEIASDDIEDKGEEGESEATNEEIASDDIEDKGEDETDKKDEDMDMDMSMDMDKEDEKDNESYAEHVQALVASDKSLSEAFKTNAKTIFETAVKSLVQAKKKALCERFTRKLSAQTRQIKADLVEKTDSYLTYVVETWMKANKVSIETGLRTEIAESFIRSLKSTFEEHYIEVPAGKRNVVKELNGKVASLTEALAESRKKHAKLSGSTEKLVRQSILAEASKGLASTQASKLTELAKNVSFDSSEAFQKKVATIKETYFRGNNSEKVLPSKPVVSGRKTTEVIIEGADAPEASLTSDMKNYLSAISRVEKNNPNK